MSIDTNNLFKLLMVSLFLTWSVASLAQDDSNSSDTDTENNLDNETDIDSFQLQEVIVTARKREESIMEVPVAVTSFDSTYLSELAVPDLLYIGQSSPNTTLKASRATNSTLTVFIRGIGQQDPLVGFEPGVGLYLDDVYIARPQGAVFQVYDVERIEVLRGPQGTLYGRNTIGGAIKYVTRRLPEEAEAKVELALGSFTQYDGIFTGSMPVTESLRIGASVASFNRDGFGENLYTGGENYDKDILSGRASMEWEPADNFFLRLATDITKDRSGSKNGHRLTVGNTSGAPVLGNVFDTRAGADVSASTAGINGNNEVTSKGTSLLMEWHLNDAIMFKSITAYREDYTESVIDFDSLPTMDFDAAVLYDNEQFSQELQMIFSGERLNAVLGVYYLDAFASNDFDVVLGNLVPPLGLTLYTFGEVNTDAWSVFADVTWDISDTLAFSLGGRFTSDERKATVLRQNYLGIGSPVFGNTDAVYLGDTGNFSSSRTDDEFTPRASFSWTPNDNQNFYLSYSEGFKGGGFDPRGSELSYPDVVNGYDPEIVESWEFGVKSKWADGRATTSFAVFMNDYTDMQIPGSVGVDRDGDGIDDDFVGTVTNAGQADISGFELEGTLMATSALMLRGMVSYIDAEFIEYMVAGENVANDRVFQNTPEWTAFASFDYRWDMDFGSNEGELGLIGSWSYRSLTHQFETANEFLDQKAYSLFDMSLIWSSFDGRYLFGLHGKNISGVDYKVAGYYFPTLGLEGSVTAFYGDARTFTATAQFNF